MPTSLPLIRTNLITGFLGVGKTTSILHLLQQYPDEGWAVLVNEFGEVGIDGALLKPSGIAIKEVPGGCMCCAAGLPTQVALNKLITEAKPRRILIEPTGLGHPANILRLLTGPDYDDVLDVRATLTLVDPRVLDDARSTGNDNFIGQVAAADRLVASKTDLSTPQQLAAFEHWAAEARPGIPHSLIHHGTLDPQWLDQPRTTDIGTSTHSAPSLLLTMTPQFSALSLTPEQDHIRKEQHSSGFHSCGWIFRDSIRFDFDNLFNLLNNLDVLRAKAVMHTSRGSFAFNLADSNLTVTEMPADGDSRIEFIGPDPINWDLLEEWLLKARL